MNNEINLLISAQKNKKPHAQNKQLNFLNKLAFTILGLVALASGVIYFITTQSSVPALKEEETAKLSELTKYHPQEKTLAEVNDRTITFSTINDKRVYLDQKLDEFEKQLPSTVTMQTVTIDASTISVTFVASNLQDIDSLLSSFQSMINSNTFLTKVELSGLALNTTDGTYNLNLNLNLL